MSIGNLVIVGASGHGKVIADIARLNGYEEIVFLDDDTSIHTCAGYPVIGKTDDYGKVKSDNFRNAKAADVVIAIGNCTIRETIQQRFEQHGFPIATLVHPQAVVAESAELGDGTVIMAGAVVNPFARLGKGCIVNTCASVDHDCVVADYVHVAVGAHLCGTVSVGAHTWIGAGAVVSNNVSVCADCMIGAGAVVVKDVEEAGTYVGMPAGKITYSLKMSEIEEGIQNWEKLKKENNAK